MPTLTRASDAGPLPRRADPDTVVSMPRSARSFRLAAVLLLVQGVLMEASAFLALPMLVVLGVDQAVIGEHVFALPYLRDNLYPMMAMSGVFAALRIAGAVGILRDKLWGFALSLVMCGVTLVLMVFLLPAGIADGILSGTALVLLLRGWFGERTLSSRN
jgi:uncharacterized membrane protein (DUF2068 family)